MSLFPVKPSGTLTKDDVIAYLADLDKKGYRIYTDPSRENVFYIELTDIMYLNIYVSEDSARIEESNGSRTRQLGTASSSGALNKIITATGKDFGINFEDTSKNTRLVKGEPLNNLTKIVSFGSPKIITEIFDPYIDEIALKNITILKRLGLKFSSNLRILTTSKSKVKLSESCWEFFKTEMKVQQAEIRTLADSHRRFLLGGGKSVHLGLSLNQIDQDEVISVERDIDDRPFFEEKWAKAAILYAKKV
jgi:hypothetical protein